MSNKQWQEFVNNYMFANYDFEYLFATRGAAFDYAVCNYIKFPYDENGKYLTIERLQTVVDSIKADESLCKLIFGRVDVDPQVYEIYDSLYIMWNIIDGEDYKYMEESELDKLYRY